MSKPVTSSGLKARVINASGWVMGGQIMTSAIRLGGNLLLTRLLVPEMFGLMAIVYVLMQAFALFSDIGLGPNIIQSRRGEDRDFLNTAWTIQILRGAFMWGLSLVASLILLTLNHLGWLPSDSVYAHPMLPLVIVVYSLIHPFAGFYPTKRLLAGRQFALARYTQIEIGTQFVGLIIMAGWAWLTHSIWALVGGTVVQAIIKLFLYRVYLPGPNDRWHWDKKTVDEIIGFGKWIFLSSIIGFLVSSGDRLLLGGLVDARLLGLYSIAYLIVSFPQNLVGQLIGSVAFPAISEVVRNNPVRVRDVYYKFRLYFDSAALFVGGVLFTFGSGLIELLYDHRYSDAGPIIEILALSMIAARYQLAERCYLALGKPDLLMPLNLLRLASMYVFVPIAFKLYHFEGAIWMIAMNEFVTLPLTLYFKLKNGIFDWKKELAVLPVFLIGAAIGWGLGYFSGPMKTVVSGLKHMLH